MFVNNIVEIIKDLRKETRVSQEEMAHFIWISRLTYINIENKKRELKQSEVEKIACFFEKPLSYFMEEEKIDDTYRSLKDLILYIAKNFKSKESLWKTMLNKLLYFSDFNYYEWTWSLISWSVYKKLPYWPVPENIDSILQQMVADGEIAIKKEKVHNYYVQKIIVVDDMINVDLFVKTDEYNSQTRENYTPYEDLPHSKNIVDTVLQKYENWTAHDISEISHDDTPYKVVKKYGEIIKPQHVFYRSKHFIVNPHNL